MENEKLNKITFLRLFSKYNFDYVDEIISEIEYKSTNSLSKEEDKLVKIHCEVQTDDIPVEESEKELNEEYLSLPQLSQITFSLPLSFGNSFQYNSEAEYESLKGRISNRFRHQEIPVSQIHHPAQQMPPFDHTQISSKSPLPLDESLESQQMRRLGEFVEWRRSLLHDCYL